MTTEASHIIEQFQKKVDLTRKRLYLRGLIGSSINALAIILLVGVMVISLESLGEFSPQIRTALFYFFSSLVIALALFFTGRSLLRYIGLIDQSTNEEIARLIGAKFPEIGDKLENVLDLAEELQHPVVNTSEELIVTSLEHFQQSTAHLVFRNAVSFAGIKKSGKLFGLLVFTVLITMLIPGNYFTSAAERLWNYDKSYLPEAQFVLDVKPGDSEILKGESILLTAKIIPTRYVRSALPTQLQLSFADVGVTAEQHLLLNSDSSGNFTYIFSSIKNSFHYSFQSEDVKSKIYSVNVMDRPFLRSMSVTLFPPKYSKLTKQQLDDNIGDVLALPGTRIEWKIVPSKKIREAFINYKSGRKNAFKMVNDHYSSQSTVSGSETYSIKLVDEQGISSSSEIEYKINLLNDDFPIITLLSPGKNVDVTQSMQLPLVLKISDDFGISNLRLYYQLVQSRFSQQEKKYEIKIPFDTVNVTNQIVDYSWDLSSLGLVPEDVVEYYAEVYDNDNINGPKSARTSSYLVRLPSLEEVFADIDKGHDEAVRTMEEAMHDAGELKKNIDEMNRELKRNQQMDWQKEKKAEEIAKRSTDIQKKLEDAGKHVDEMVQNMQRNNILSQETLEKYAELQKLMQEINSTEFQEALKRMQQAMKNVSPEQLRQAMEQVQFSEEQFRSSIERTLNLIKRIQIEQKVDELVKRSQSLKEQQSALENETQKSINADQQQAQELSRKQEDLNKQLKEMQNALKDVQQKMEEFPKEMPLNKLQEAEQAVNDQEMENAMQQSAEQLRSQQMKNAVSSQQKASSGMQKMSEQISELQEQLLNNQLQQTMNDLSKAMQDLLQVSQQEEQLKNQSRSLDPNSQQFREIGRQQQNLQGDMSNIANALNDLSQKSFVVTPDMGKEIGKAMVQMQQAMESIVQRNAGLTSSSQEEAMASMNKAAMLVQGAMQSLQQQGGQGGGSLLQQLRGMAMQQQSINMQTQQLSQQGGLSQQQLQEMGRIANQQNVVRKSLEQLEREARESPERNRVLGDLNKIAEEMKEVTEKLQQNNANPATLQQQERILSRLLQAQRSMRERDFEQRRRAASGITPIKRSPVILTDQSRDAQMRRDIQRAMESGYSKDYLELIRKYYEAISKEH